jgi:adenylate kinase family enzyme
MIIGIAGPTASGKTTIAHMLGEKLGAFRIKYSDILSGIAFERNLDPEDKATLQNLFLSERETRGEDFLTKEMERKVMQSADTHIIIEGNRRLVDIDMLKRVAQAKKEKLLLLFIEASIETRFNRYNERLAYHDQAPISFDEFLELEQNGAEDELAQLRLIFQKEGALIDANKNTPEEIFQQVTRLL